MFFWSVSSVDDLKIGLLSKNSPFMRMRMATLTVEAM